MSKLQVLGRGIYLQGVRVGVIIEDAQPSFVEEFKYMLENGLYETKEYLTIEDKVRLSAYNKGYLQGVADEKKKWETNE